MPDYVADTHSLLWHLTRSERLSPRAARAFDEVSAGIANLIVPVIVLAELVFALEKGRVRVDWSGLLGDLQSIPNVHIVDLSLARILDLRSLTTIPEMHDRMIVAETLAHNAILITRDQAITASGVVPVLW